MDKALKQRLVGASVLIILAVIVLPMLLSGRSDRLNTESRQIELPPKPDELSFETRRFPVGVPDKPVAPPPQGIDEQGSGDTLPLQREEESNGPQPIEDGLEESTATEMLPEDLANETEKAVADTVVAPPAVTTVVLDPAENTKTSEPEPSTSTPGQPRYLVQVASFSNEARANAMAAELRASKMPVAMDVVDRTAGRLHRVRVGPYANRSDADAVVKQIQSMNKDLRPRIMDTRPGDSAPVSAPSDPLVRWVVQVGSYNNAATAESEVAKLRLIGLTAFSEKVTSAKGTAYKVRIGPEINRENAYQLKNEIKAKHHIDGFVTTQEH